MWKIGWPGAISRSFSSGALASTPSKNTPTSHFQRLSQFVGSFEPADALFAHSIAQLAQYVGFRP